MTRRVSGGGRIRVTAPSGVAADVEVRVLKDAPPRLVAALAPDVGPMLVVTDWLSERTQAILRCRGASFLDATGNVEIRLSEPGLFVRTEGAKRNPSPTPTRGPSVRGPKAWALLRTLAEVPPPLGVRALAGAVDVDAGYVSRVLRTLEYEVLVTRAPRGPVTDVDWEGVLRRAAATYSLFDSNETTTWMATSGPEHLLDDLPGRRTGRWAVWAVLAPDRPPGVTADPNNAWDAIFTAARYLCAGADHLDDVRAAVLRYNHSDVYADQVLEKATQYWLGGPASSALPAGAAGAGDAAVGAALTQLGVPYVWGGETPGVGFDCSGLVQWAYAQAGVSLPRTTFGQIDIGVPVTVDELRPATWSSAAASAAARSSAWATSPCTPAPAKSSSPRTPATS